MAEMAHAINFDTRCPIIVLERALHAMVNRGAGDGVIMVLWENCCVRGAEGGGRQRIARLSVGKGVRRSIG